MKPNNVYLYLFLFLVIIWSCADRSRKNPLDPNNPETLGRPAGPEVFSIQDTVFLKWDKLNLDDLTGYQIFRKTNLADDFSLLSFEPPSIHHFLDTAVEFGIDYSYRISAVGVTYEIAYSDEVEILPGPTFNWIAEQRNRQLIKLTHDSRYKISSVGGFFRISQIVPNPSTGLIWVVDVVNQNFGQVVRVSPEGSILSPTLTFTKPVAASIDSKSGALWLADAVGQVTKLNSAGEVLFQVTDFSNPVGVAVDQRTSECWVADNHSNQLVKLNSDGSPVFTSPVDLEEVISIVTNSNDGSLWVAESNGMTKVNESGSFELEITLSSGFIVDIEVNSNTGDLWVLKWDPAEVIKFSAAGVKQFELDGFSDPEDLSVNLFDNSCLVADTGNNRLVRISAAGQIVRVFEDLFFPVAVGIENDPNLP